MHKELTLKELAAALVDTRRLKLHDTAQLNAIHTGNLVHLHGSFYYPEQLHSQLAWHQKRTLEALAVGSEAQKSVLIGRSAGRILGIWVVSTTDEHVEITNPKGRITAKRDRKPGVRYHGIIVREHEQQTVLTCRTTTALRTVIDIARLHGFAEGLIARDWALAHGYSQEELSATLASMGRARGVAQARMAIHFAVDISQSAFESWARALLLEAGYRNITLQVRVGPFYIDIVVNGVIAIEIDGGIKYKDDASVAETLRKEAARHKYLQNHGYWVLRFSPQDILRDPAGFIANVAEALAGHERVGSPRPRLGYQRARHTPIWQQARRRNGA